MSNEKSLSTLLITLMCLWVVLFMGAWDKDKPAASTSLRASNPEMLANQAALETAIGQDHEFSTGGTNSGKHIQVTFDDPLSAAPTTVAASEGVLYLLDVSNKAELHFEDEDENTIQITDTGGINGTALKADSVDSAAYAAGSIDLEHLSVNSVDSDQYVDGSIDAVHLAADVIDETKIADDGIDSEHYNDGSIDAVHLASGTIPTFGTPTLVASKTNDASYSEADDASTASTQLTTDTYITAWAQTDSGASTGISIKILISPNGSSWTTMGFIYCAEAGNELDGGSCTVLVPNTYYWKAVVAKVWGGTTIQTDRYYYKTEME